MPHQYVRRTFLVEATLKQVRIVDGINVVAEHGRSFDKGKQIENASHIEALEVEIAYSHRFWPAYRINLAGEAHQIGRQIAFNLATSAH